MPNKLQTDQADDNKPERDKTQTIFKRISDQVIQALGSPNDLRQVQVLKVWDDHYRVNVVVGLNAGSVRVANSYFLVVDGSGSLITSTPKITKQY